MAQPFNFGFAESLPAQLAGVTHYALHSDVGAICAAADAVAPLARRLAVDPPPPHLAGFAYVHVSTLGAQIVHGPQLMEPAVVPCLRDPHDIDHLAEPDDYLSAGMVPQRLELARRLRQRRANASPHIGHDFQGPVTTAALLMGQSFFTLPHDDPLRAHRLLEFCARSAVDYCRALRACQRRAIGGQPEGLCDDFAGIFGPEQFREFVVPYWQQMYERLGASQRWLHSELLRPEHMPFLEELKIDSFDPSVDQYLPPETLARCCKVPYGLRIWPSMVRDMSSEQLVKIYRSMAARKTRYITFHMASEDEEDKIAALLKTARELQ